LSRVRARVGRWLLLAVMLGAGDAAAQSPPGPTFPTVSSYSLAKARVTLPADLHADRNLLLLYFKLDQQSDVNGWNAVIDQWRRQSPSLGAYTCLVSPRSNLIFRWFQNSLLHSDLPSTRWNSTVPLYVDKPQFRKALGIDTEKQVVLLVIDRQGRVLARFSGPPTAQSRAALRDALGNK
jgi:hypothetical protein